MLILVSLLSMAVLHDPHHCAPQFDFAAHGYCEEQELGLTVQQAEEYLGDRASVIVPDQEALLWIERGSGNDARSCCSIQTPLTPLGNGIFAMRIRLFRQSEAVLDQFVLNAPDDFTDRSFTYRGPEARAPLERIKLEADVISTTFVSEHLDEERHLNIWLPPGHTPDVTYPIVVLADGGGLAWTMQLIEHRVLVGELRPFIAVGVPSGARAIVGEPDLGFDVRAADYLPGYEDTDRFERHLAWIADEVLPYVARRYGASTRAEDVTVTGKSNGGVFAHAAAHARPDVFGQAVVLSRGYSRGHAPSYSAAHADQTYLFAAGHYEPSFKATTRGEYERARASGIHAAYRSYAGGHDPQVWDSALIDALSLLLPAE